jgi:hypothetical protein
VFPLRHRVAPGVLLPTQYVRIVPTLAWGANFNYSIWYVCLRGIDTPDYTQQRTCVHWGKASALSTGTHGGAGVCACLCACVCARMALSLCLCVLARANVCLRTMASLSVRAVYVSLTLSPRGHPVLVAYHAYREREALRLCLQHLRHRSYLDVCAGLEQVRTGHRILTERDA